MAARKRVTKSRATREAENYMASKNAEFSNNRAMSLCDQAEDALSTLEARLSKIIRRINSINTL